MIAVVEIVGCDAITEFRLELSDDEAATLRRLAHASEVMSQYGCEPTVRITPFDAAQYDDLVSAPEFAPWTDGVRS